MFEITYNDADALERYEEEKRAYPGAKYDFTFEKRFLVYHADMLHQIIYYAIDMKTGLSSEVMRRKSGSPIKKAEYASVLMDRLMDSIKYVGDRRTYLSEGIAPLHMIDNIFCMILPHSGFAVREEQIELAKTLSEKPCLSAKRRSEPEKPWHISLLHWSRGTTKKASTMYSRRSPSPLQALNCRK